MSKICTDCNVEKNEDCFYKSKSSSDGFMSICKPCQKIRAKLNYNQNKSNRIEQISDWKEQNRNKDLAYKRKSYHKKKNK